MCSKYPQLLTTNCALITQSSGAPISDSLRSNLYLLRQALDKPFNVPMLKTHPGAGWSVCSPDGVKG